MRSTRAAFLALVAGAVAPPRAFGDLRDDLEILNFALIVEYVQSALYREALERVPGLSADTRAVITDLRDHEVEHVDALRATIRDAGGTPYRRRRIRFGEELATPARFLKLANTLEDAGVSGYNGAAPALESEDLVAAFGSIVQVEARHAALIRALRDRPAAPLALDKASNQQAVRQRYGPYTVE